MSSDFYVVLLPWCLRQAGIVAECFDLWWPQGHGYFSEINHSHSVGAAQDRAIIMAIYSLIYIMYNLDITCPVWHDIRHCKNKGNVLLRLTSLQKHPIDAKITSLLRQNDVATSFWPNNDIIFASRVRWAQLVRHGWVIFVRTIMLKKYYHTSNICCT